MRVDAVRRAGYEHVGDMAADRLRVLIADDERPARRFLAGILQHVADVDVVGEAASGAEALQMIAALAPDVVLLDWQMPELNGWQVAQQLSTVTAPALIFVTAFSEHAHQAAERSIDYLLKPVDVTSLSVHVHGGPCADERSIPRLLRAEPWRAGCDLSRCITLREACSIDKRSGGPPTRDGGFDVRALIGHD